MKCGHSYADNFACACSDGCGTDFEVSCCITHALLAVIYAYQANFVSVGLVNIVHSMVRLTS